MIPPRKVKFMAKKKVNENIRFRSYLKMHADETELDEQFLRLHNELFEQYDCNRCRNCCKMFYGSMPEGDVQKDADWVIADLKIVRSILTQINRNDFVVCTVS